nr:MAG TPA: hypothetical protein [Caudoviricetes sp.]
MGSVESIVSGLILRKEQLRDAMRRMEMAMIGETNHEQMVKLWDRHGYYEASYRDLQAGLAACMVQAEDGSLTWSEDRLRRLWEQAQQHSWEY